jgi:hypothetical protein
LPLLLLSSLFALQCSYLLRLLRIAVTRKNKNARRFRQASFRGPVSNQRAGLVQSNPLFTFQLYYYGRNDDFIP